MHLWTSILDFLAPLIIITNTTNLLFSFLLSYCVTIFTILPWKYPRLYHSQVTVIIHAKSLQSFNHPCNEISFCSLAQNKRKNFTTTFSGVKPKNFSQDRVKINCRIATDITFDRRYLLTDASFKRKEKRAFLINDLEGWEMTTPTIPRKDLLFINSIDHIVY